MTAYKSSDGGTQVLRDCADNDRAAGEVMRLQTVDEITADLKGWFYPFVDSGDGCSPAARGGCLDNVGVTFDPDGRRWESAAGATSFSIQTQPSEAMVVGATSGLFPSVDLNTLIGAGETVTTSPEHCLDITNPSDCRNLRYVIHYGMHVSQALLTAGWRIRLSQEVQLDGGAWTSLGKPTYDSRFRNAGITEETVYYVNPTLTSGVLAPGVTRQVCTRLLCEVVNDPGGGFALLSLPALRLFAWGDLV